MNAPQKREGRFQLDIFEALLSWLILVSISSVLLLISGIFTAVHALFIGTILFGGGVIFFRAEINYRREEFNGVLLLILLLAFFFRFNPYSCIMGGQDQGVYVSMSSQYEKTGSPFIKDAVRSHLTDQGIQWFDKSNHLDLAVRKKGQFEGAHVPGVYIKDLDASTYVFQFYPLHPLWLAIGGKIFGSDNRVYSVVFFSLLTIIIFYLIALDLSDGKKYAAYTVALFLSFNPLHSFFSKFPVSEIMTLFFSSAGSYFLIRYFRKIESAGDHSFYLFLSAGSFSCLFFNHVAGFMYMPLFYLLLLTAIVFLQNGIAKRYIVAYCVAIFCMFGMSLWYGFSYSYPYTYAIYQMTFGKYLGESWGIALLAITASLFLLPIVLLSVRERIYSHGSAVRSYLQAALPVLTVAVILLGFFRAYEMGFTGKYIGDSWIHDRWHMDQKGWMSFLYTNISAFILYLSPFAFCIYVPAVYKTAGKRNAIFIALNTALLLFLFLRVAVNFTVPYQYYYARYLLAEVVPWALLLVAFYLAERAEKKSFGRGISIICIAAMLIYFGYFTVLQLKGTPGKDANRSLSRIAKELDGSDILLLYKKNMSLSLYYRVKTPLSYYYDLNVADFDDFGSFNPILAMLSHYNDIFVLSAVPLKNPLLSDIDIVRYEDNEPEHANVIPRGWITVSEDMHLYKVNKRDFSNVTKVLTERRVGWTSGDLILNDISYVIKPGDKYLVLKTHGWHPWKNDFQKIGLKISVNGTALAFSHLEKDAYYFKLGRGIKSIAEVRIASSTFVPKELGINSDTRHLGIDVESITIE